MTPKADSGKFFEKLWLAWLALGVAKNGVQYKKLFLLYGIVVSIIGAVGYPIHLALALFTSDTLADNIQNLSLTIIIAACTMKFTFYTMRIRKVREADAIFRQLDERVQYLDEYQHLQRVGVQLTALGYLFLIFYFGIGITGAASVIAKEERSLLVPGWFPFDWRASLGYFYLAYVYQIWGLTCHLTMNYMNDCYPPVALCLLTEHVNLLGIRVSKLGYDCEDKLENERQLLLCIKDHKNIYKLFHLLQEIISQPLFLQFVVTAFNMCLALAAMLFFVDTWVQRLYYFSYFVATVLQIFPACYYGSILQLLFSDLHYDIFSSNWIEQTPTFKKHMLILTERSQKSTTAMAGGMFRIHLDFFFSTVKATYSLFAIIMRMRN